MTGQLPAPSAVDELRALAARVCDPETVRRLMDAATYELTGRTVIRTEHDLQPRRFVLRRYEDVSGISGEGRVADGVLWPDRTASIRWRGEHPSIVFWDRGRVSVEVIHGHQGRTEIEWIDPEQPDVVTVPQQQRAGDD